MQTATQRYQERKAAYDARVRRDAGLSPAPRPYDADADTAMYVAMADENFEELTPTTEAHTGAHEIDAEVWFKGDAYRITGTQELYNGGYFQPAYSDELDREVSIRIHN